MEIQNPNGIRYWVKNPNTTILTIDTDTTQYVIPPLTYYIKGVKYEFAWGTFSAGFVPTDTFLVVWLNAASATTWLPVTQKNVFFDSDDLVDTVELWWMATQDWSNITIIWDSVFFYDEVYNNLYRRNKIFIGTIFLWSAGLISENTTPLQLDIAGWKINDPDSNVELINAIQSVWVSEVYNVASNYTIQPETPNYSVNVTQYDNWTGLTTLSNNKFAAHTILRSSRTSQLYMVFSTAEYDNEANALEAPINRWPFDTEWNEVEPIAQVIVKKNTTSIDQISDVRNNIAGVISASTATLQNTYDRSWTSPQIITSVAWWAFWVQRWSWADTDNILEGKNWAWTTTFAVTWEGNISWNNLSWTNTWDQTSIVWITWTKAQFDTACTDWDFFYDWDTLSWANVSWDIAWNAANVNWTVAIANWGSGQTTQQAAIDALTNVAAATNEYVLTKDTATWNAVFKAAAWWGWASWGDQLDWTWASGPWLEFININQSNPLIQASGLLWSQAIAANKIDLTRWVAFQSNWGTWSQVWFWESVWFKYWDNFNTNSPYESYWVWIENENNWWSWENTGIKVDNRSSDFVRQSNAAVEWVWLSLFQFAWGTACAIDTSANLNNNGNGLVNLNLNNSQSGASRMMRITTWTSTQDHTSLYLDWTRHSMYLGNTSSAPWTTTNRLYALSWGLYWNWTQLDTWGWGSWDAFNATKSSTQSINNNAVTIAAFGTEEFDDGWNFASNTYTAPSAGQYYFEASLVRTWVFTTGFQWIYIYVNWVEAKQVRADSSKVGSEGTQLISWILDLSASDTVDIRVKQTSGSARSIDNTAATNYFSWYRIK